MMMAPDRGDVTTALVAALNSDAATAIPEIVAASGSQDVFGDGIAPGPVTRYPFGIVVSITSGPIAQDNIDGANTLNPDLVQHLIFQISCYGRNRQQADFLAAKAARTILDMTANPRGHRVPIIGSTTKVIFRTRNASSGTHPTPDALWRNDERYQLTATPFGVEAQYG